MKGLILTGNDIVGRVIIPAGVYPWSHELRVAQLLAEAGHMVEFIPELRKVKTADILVDGVAYEIKSPITGKSDKLERVIKRALKQSQNIVYDSSRIKGVCSINLRRFLENKAGQYPQIKN